MTHLEESIREGHYARKQLFCKDWLISWSHRSRFEIGLNLAQQLAAGKKVLDYGCGDGTFLSLLMSRTTTPPSLAVGAEIAPSMVDDCRNRLGQQRGLSFVIVDELNAAEHMGSYGLVTCMEVLEHVVEIEPLLDKLASFMAPSGKLLISVPVETGLPLIVKQAARHIAGWRGLGDYPGVTSYTLGEYWSSLFAGRRQHIMRPTHKGVDGKSHYDHKGFNWMALRESITQRFVLEKTLGSPVTQLPPHFASQVWFLAQKKA